MEDYDGIKQKTTLQNSNHLLSSGGMPHAPPEWREEFQLWESWQWRFGRFEMLFFGNENDKKQI